MRARTGGGGGRWCLVPAVLASSIVSAFGLGLGLGPLGGRLCAADPLAAVPTVRPAVLPLEASPSRGIFRERVKVSLSTETPDASIRYTLDGSSPRGGGAKTYTRELELGGTAQKAVVILRAVATRAGLDPSAELTASYVFVERVPSQPTDPGGFPSKWLNAPAADYGMDPEITGSGRYKGRLVESLLSLPSLSLVCSVEDLFGPEGLYSNSLEHGSEWERPASAELIFPDGREGFQVSCGLRIYGGANRQTNKCPKHSFRLLFKGEYGPTRLRYPLYPDSTVQSFDSLILRGGYNNTWLHQHSSQRAHGQYIQDSWARETLLAMGTPESHGLFVHLYLAGLYWGIYNIAERPNAAFAASYFGGEKEDYDAVNSGSAVDGDLVAWKEMFALAEKGLASPSAYRDIQEHLDVQSLADYMILNLYGGNKDWPGHNWYAVRRRQPGASYLFLSWDAERVLESVTEDQMGADDPESPARLFQLLRANPEFRVLFGDRVERHLRGEGALTPQAAAARYRRLADGVEKAVVAESARWGDYRRDVHSWEVGPYELYTPDDQWVAERDRLLASYFPQRTDIVLEQFRRTGLYPRVMAPVPSKAPGQVPAGTSLSFALASGQSGTIYYTLDGVDPRTPGSGEVARSARAFSKPLRVQELTLVLARTLDAGKWSALFEGAYHTPSAPPEVSFDEVLYAPLGGKDYEFIELLNRGAGFADLSGAQITGGVSYEVPEGVLLAPGERLVICGNPLAFVERYPGAAGRGVQPLGPFSGSLDNAGEEVLLLDREGALLARLDYDDENGWPIGPDVLGFSLVAAPASSLGVPYRASVRIHGSPGEEDPAPTVAEVVVNEVLPGGSTPYEDAVELYNPGDEAVHVGGWYLSDSREDESSLKGYRLPADALIGPHGFLVLYGEQLSGGLRGVKLSREGGGIYLSSADESGNLTGLVTGWSFPGLARNLSYGLHLTASRPLFCLLERPTFGVGEPDDLAAFRKGRGATNALPKAGPVVVSELLYHAADGDPEEFVELRNLTGEAVALYRDDLQRGWVIHGIRAAGTPEGGDDYELPEGATIAARGFALIVNEDPDAFRRRRSISPDVTIYGPYAGALDNGGERIRLLRPEADGSSGSYLALVDDVRFDDELPWPLEADGAGSSLVRVDLQGAGSDPASWAASTQPGGAPGSPADGEIGPQNLPPTAVIAAQPVAGVAPLVVLFDGSASRDADGSVRGFTWSFGDGEAADRALIPHEYVAAGDYSVRLEVVDNEGAVGVATLTVHVDPAPVPPPPPPPPPPPDPIPEPTPLPELPVLLKSLPTSLQSYSSLLAALASSHNDLLFPLPASGELTLPGSAWVLDGRLRGKLKGLHSSKVDGAFVLVLGPFLFKDGAGESIFRLPEGAFLLVNDRDRVLFGAYSQPEANKGKSKSKLLWVPLEERVQGFVAESIEDVLFERLEAPDLVRVSRLTMASKVQSNKSGETLRLKVSIRYTVGIEGADKRTLRKGRYSFSGRGAPAPRRP